MKKGAIILNAYSHLKPVTNQAEKLKNEFSQLGVGISVFKNGSFGLYINDNGEIVNELKNYDFCVYLDKDKYSSHLLEKSGLRLFNSHAAIRACDDKMLTFALLSQNGVPVPATVAAPIRYTPSATPDEAFLTSAAKKLGYPLIIKQCYGSRGQSVYKADNFEQLKAYAVELQCTPHIYQRFIKESAGKDARVIVIGGKITAAMKRSSKTDFRSNMDLGGEGAIFTPDKEITNLCLKVAKILNLDYCGVDVLFGKDGYLICEVNSNAFFDGIESVTGVNVARAYARHIFNEIYGK
ncbi:MAG: RimK family alpha-L-glutamate ligase [Clostridia bacterium]|nr:RimK family alpha-L-glutamate ligase [Clostridia bacterium]